MNNFERYSMEKENQIDDLQREIQVLKEQVKEQRELKSHFLKESITHLGEIKALREQRHRKNMLIENLKKRFKELKETSGQERYNYQMEIESLETTIDDLKKPFDYVPKHEGG